MPSDLFGRILLSLSIGLLQQHVGTERWEWRLHFLSSVRSVCSSLKNNTHLDKHNNRYCNKDCMSNPIVPNMNQTATNCTNTLSTYMCDVTCEENYDPKPSNQAYCLDDSWESDTSNYPVPSCELRCTWNFNHRILRKIRTPTLEHRYRGCSSKYFEHELQLHELELCGTRIQRNVYSFLMFRRIHFSRNLELW